MTDSLPVLRPEIKFIVYAPWDPDADVEGSAPDNLIDWVPSNPEFFGVTVALYIGTPDDDLTDEFEAMVCSPSWFAAQGHLFDRDPAMDDEWPAAVLPGKDFWFMDRWDAAAFMAAVRLLLGRASAATWPDLAMMLALDLRWDREGE